MGQKLNQILKMSKERTQHQLTGIDNAINQVTRQKEKLEQKLKGLAEDKKQLTEHLADLEAKIEPDAPSEPKEKAEDTG